MNFLTALIRFCHPDGASAFDGTFKFSINESRIKKNNRDERVFDWLDDGKDIEVTDVKYTFLNTGGAVPMELVRTYFILYDINPVEHLAESATIDRVIAKYLKEWDEIDEEHDEENRRDMNETYNSLNRQFIN